MDFMKGIVRVTENPFGGLCIGLLATAIIQSSSTLTSSLVALVASGAVSLEAAVPLVMGANIGTTITGIVVSLGHLGTAKAFRRGFSVASSHVIFNLLSVLIFFPLELKWGVLSGSSRYLASHISNWGKAGDGWFWFYEGLISPVAGFLAGISGGEYYLLLPASLLLLFLCIWGLTLLFRQMLLAEGENQPFARVLARPGFALFSGASVTAALHSSSVTTSLCVMLAATEKLSVKKLFPIVLGANIGTTVTALMAAIGRSEAAVAIALCHLLFNVAGVILVFPLPFIRSLPLRLARWTGTQAQKNLVFAFAYLLILFFALPFILMYWFEKG